jgi:cytochrome P450
MTTGTASKREDTFVWPVSRRQVVGQTVRLLVKGTAIGDELRSDQDVEHLKFGSRRFLVLGHPDLIDRVLYANRTNYVKSVEFEPLRALTGLNLLTDEGESWAYHRGELNSVFSRRRLDDIVDLIADPIVDYADELSAHTGRVEFDIHEDMVGLTLRVVANALFSQDFGDLIDRMHDLVTAGLRRAEVMDRLGMVGAFTPRGWSLLAKIAYQPVPLPPPLREFQRIARGMEQGIQSILDERARTPSQRRDLLDQLMEADGGTWPRKRIRDEALTFVLAGHETTANALSWFWYLLTINPDARARMLAEIDQVLGHRRPTAADLHELPYTTACIQESQRYFSAVYALPRTALEDDWIGPHFVPAGTTVIMPSHRIHHDERWWPEPAEFRPERFLTRDADRPRSAYLPFGGGRRVCIGQSFALMEMVLVAAVLSQRFTFDLVPGHPVEPETTLTLRPKHGIRVVARRRSDPPGDPAATAQSDPAEAAARCPVSTDDLPTEQPGDL